MSEASQQPTEVKGETESKRRELRGHVHRIIFAVAVSGSVFRIYFVGFRPLTPWLLYIGHLAFTLVLAYSLFPVSPKAPKNRIPLYDLGLMLAGIAACVYLATQMNEIIYRIGVAPTPADLVASLTLTLLVLEMCRRTNGIILPLLAIGFLLYARFGNFIPGLMGHRGYGWDRILSYMTSFQAIFSTPFAVSATFVYLFLLFSSFLNASGAGRFFIDLALSLTGSTRGGPAKTAVVASALFGTVSGNSTANVVSTGAFTIPLMKSIGYSPTFAGAVEVVASAGGQIMPPILGSAAFIMAQLIGVSYLRIVTAAILPAALYFLAAFVMVDIEAVKLKLQGIPRAQLPLLRRVLASGGHLMIPLFVLIFVLVVMKASAIRAALLATLSIVVVANLKRSTRMGPAKVVGALAQGGFTSVSMISACAVAGLVIGVLNLTGAGLKLAGAIVSASGGNLPLALFLTMVAALIMGMGLPTTASYLICAAVAAPALIELGVSNLAAHMFVFYFACISALTPPVALAAYAAASIARAKPLEVATTACKLGITAFIVPYFFIYGPSLLWQGTGGEVFVTAVTAAVGAVALACGIQGRVFSLRIGVLERVLLLGCALALIFPGAYTDLVGVAVIAGVAALVVIRSRRQLTIRADV